MKKLFFSAISLAFIATSCQKDASTIDNSTNSSTSKASAITPNDAFYDGN